MKPFIKAYVDQMAGLINQLAMTLERYDEHLEHARHEKAALTRRHWSDQRQINAMEETIKGLPALQKHTSALEKRNQEIEERVRRILAYTKAVSEAIQE